MLRTLVSNNSKFRVTGTSMISRFFGTRNGLATYSGIRNTLIDINPEINRALQGNYPVVALESTIITHGMPYPTNLQVAKEVEKIIRDNKVQPATIGVIDGRIKIGLTEGEIEHLAKSSNTIKIARRDLSIAIAKQLSGGTTVSATMLLAHYAGIKVFVTGGIGGVHRGGELSMDISADLLELGKIPVMVVCAGVKSILDIGLTLEYLETNGVTVMTLGNDSNFPGFFTAESGYKSPHTVSSPKEAALVFDASKRLGISSGMIVAVPIPKNASASGELVNSTIHTVLANSKSEGITGKSVTPYILQNVNLLTKGESLKANIELIKNNAKVGSHIASEYTSLQSEKSQPNPIGKNCRITDRNTDISCARPIVIGASIVDNFACANFDDKQSEDTHQGKIRQSYGGVGRNVAECLTRLGCDPLFISVIGNDLQGKLLLDHCKQAGMDVTGIETLCNGHRTSTYSAVSNTTEEVLLAVGDMNINEEISCDLLKKYENHLISAPIICMDGNISEEAINYVLSIATKHSIPVWFEPTTVSKAPKILTSKYWRTCTYVSPNLSELTSLCEYYYNYKDSTKTLPKGAEKLSSIDDKISYVSESMRCLQFPWHLIVTLGADGVLLIQNNAEYSSVTEKALADSTTRLSPIVTHFPAISSVQDPITIANVTGSGDSFAGGMIAAILKGHDINVSVEIGLRCAFLTVQSFNAVSEYINPNHLSKNYYPKTKGL